MNRTFNSVFIVDDDPAVRDSLSLMIEQEGFSVETFDSAEGFIAAQDRLMCGCMILDLRMPGMDGIRLQQQLLSEKINIPVIFLTGHGDIPTSVKAIKAGAIDFLTKPVTREKLIATIRAALETGERARATLIKSEHAQSMLQQLTEREREVMALAVLGHPNKEIARNLGISHRTVEIHKAKIMQKTGALNVLDLARLAQEGGLLG